MNKPVQYGNKENIVFIYQTKKLYNENGDGPFDALVITNGEQGAKPAEVEQTVMALTQETETDSDVTLHNIQYYDEFVVGEKPVPYIELYYNDNIIENGSTLDLPSQGIYASALITINTNVDPTNLTVTSSNPDITASGDIELLNFTLYNKSAHNSESKITVSDGNISQFFNIVLYGGE